MRREVVPGSPRLVVSSPSALFPSGNEPDRENIVATQTVTALRESPRTPGRYVVTLGDGRSFVVGVSALADTGATRVGATLEESAIARLVREAAVSDLVARAVGMLARGRRTRRELELRLRRREPDIALVSAALEKLEASGLISDQDVARAEASSRLRRGEAPIRVKQALRIKGITGRDATQAVAEAAADDAFDEVAACRAAVAKRVRSLSTLEPPVARRRLIAFLQRRGFGGSVLLTAVDEYFKSSRDH